MLMTMTQKSQKLTFPFTKENRKLVKDMLLLQQHPFILPIADIDFMVDQNIVVVVYPVCVRGSLKDYIYQVCFCKKFNVVFMPSGSIQEC